MSYQVLARKWRPRSFSTLVGQEHVVRALTHALEQQRLHHAYLFTGTRGVGKTTLARILAKSLNCETGITPAPCGQCGSCLEIDAGRFVDLIEVDAATNTRVDEMRQLLDNAAYAPTRGRYKVYVIDEVHMLSNSAFNAMLKTLEEPPEHIKFILATTDPQKIPITVLSRCLQFNLKQMPVPAIVGHLDTILKAEGVRFEPGALLPIAKAAAGSMRDALSLLDQAIAHGAGSVEEQGVRDMLGTVGEDYLYAILDALAAGDAPAMMALARAMEARSLNFELALRELGVLLHRVALAQLAPSAIADDVERERLLRHAERLDAEFVQLAYQIVTQGCADLSLAPDDMTGFSMCLLRLVAFRPEAAAPLPATVKQSAALQAPPPVARTSVAVEAPTAPPALHAERTDARDAEFDAWLAAQPTDARDGVSGAASAPELGPERQREAPGGDWHALVTRLDLSGMGQQLAHQCELVALGEPVVRLRIARSYQTLVNGGQEKLRGALERVLDRPVSLQFEYGELAGQTVAQKLSAEQQAKVDQARAAMKADPFVLELQEQFDARLIEDAIRPL